MSAPLYNRYRRYADREAKRFSKDGAARVLVPSWKRPDTRVYSMTERASYEAGAWSAQPPGELLRAMALHYLPNSRVWIELDFDAYQKGVNGIPFDSTGSGLIYTERGIRYSDSEETPLRIGVMLYHPSAHGAGNFFEGDDDTISGLIFYLYKTGTCFIGPALYAWRTDDEDDGAYMAAPENLQHAAISPFYIDKYQGQNPRLMSRLGKRVFMGNLSHKYGDLSPEVHGTTRMAIAALTAALSARGVRYDPTGQLTPADAPKGHHAPNQSPIEVDLFLRERPRKPGGSIRASVGHLEGIKKGLHTVGAHWAYRARSDGGDPTQCTKVDNHVWEDIEGTKSQVCLACGQKRWFRKQHERGDEKYGVVPPKTYNIRAGLVNLSAPEKASTE